MKRKLVILLACMSLLMTMPVTAHADMGPKPSIQIQFTGIEGEIYYGTLLSQERSTGPYAAWDGEDYEGHSDIWKKFAEYQDADGFYFLQKWWECSETNQLNWTYYPPDTFKILLYFPESDSFYVSSIYQRYAFDSYYTVDLSAYAAAPLVAEKNYDYSWELISLVVRILLTFALEMAVALMFGYREKKLLRLLAIVNSITQIILNVLLNALHYYSGALAFAFAYIPLELLVFFMEAIAYALLIPRYSNMPQSRGKAIGYAFLANALSFIAGLWLARLIPGIF